MDTYLEDVEVGTGVYARSLIRGVKEHTLRRRLDFLARCIAGNDGRIHIELEAADEVVVELNDRVERVGRRPLLRERQPVLAVGVFRLADSVHNAGWERGAVDLERDT